uniref:Uncharacterized protein n=1 Tax=Anguilla anguilla TaxID=7936 RepID=A0A0E9XLB4_ANGAN
MENQDKDTKHLGQAVRELPHLAHQNSIASASMPTCKYQKCLTLQVNMTF